MPLPPSLKLPEVVTNLSASRVGNRVVLNWTTPSTTTDGMDIVRPDTSITAEICREAAKVGIPASPATATGCISVMRVAVKPGASTASDSLPGELTSPNATPGVLTYRIQLLNPANRTAGPSDPAFAASGPPVPPVEHLEVDAGKFGTILRWSPVPGRAPLPAESVEIDRTTVVAPPRPTRAPAQANPPAATPAAKPAASRRNPLPPAATPATQITLKVAFDAPGVDSVTADGALDRSAEIGATYRYTAQRLRPFTLAGHALEQRSEPSAPATLTVLDIFPPEPPRGLVAAPGFSRGGPGNAAQVTLDLIWEPGTDARLAGYNVYRQEVRQDTTGRPAAGSAQRINPAPVAIPSYRDASVIPGRRYVYRVTAVDTTGKESEQSSPVVEIAPSQ